MEYILPDWPHNHTPDVGSEGLPKKVGDVIEEVGRVTVNGSLQWQLTAVGSELLLRQSRRVPDGKDALSGAAVVNGVRRRTMSGR